MELIVRSKEGTAAAAVGRAIKRSYVDMYICMCACK